MLIAPMLGQHNDEILGGELGLSAEELQNLRTCRIIGVIRVRHKVTI